MIEFESEADGQATGSEGKADEQGDKRTTWLEWLRDYSQLVRIHQCFLVMNVGGTPLVGAWETMCHQRTPVSDIF